MTSSLPPLAQASSGAIGAIISNALVYPLDTLTTRLQTTSRKPGRASKGYNSLLSGLQTIVKEEGWSGLYRGLGSDSLSTGLSNFIYFYTYSFLIARLTTRKLRRAPPAAKGAPVLSALEELAIGCLAGVLSKAVVTPLSNVTVRQQTSTAAKVKSDAEGEKERGDVDDSDDEDGTYGTAPSMSEIIHDILQEKGWTGLWSGFKSAIILTINPAITYYMVDFLKRMVIPVKHREHPTLAQTFLTGSFASAFASAVTYPLILSKTRLQFKSPSGRRLYSSTYEVFTKTIKKRGVAGMYQGLESQLFKGFFSEGAKLTVKDRLEAIIILLHHIAVRKQQQAVA